jgi:dihydropteroate synthase
MGICNVTPDSFSDGGQHAKPADAIVHGLGMAQAGADIIDVGGESTRPGAGRVSLEEELARVLPVVRALAGEGVAVSIDTMRAEVARQAVEAGAVIVNDVSGGRADQAMYGEVARSGAVYILMHWRGHSDTMDSLDRYQDVVGEVRSELAAALAAAQEGGIAADRIVLDPGLGFAKAGQSNWPLLSHLDALATLGQPILVGASRKRFLAPALADLPSDGAAAGPAYQLEDMATAAITSLAALGGAWAVRVHDVAPSAVAVRVAGSWTGGL